MIESNLDMSEKEIELFEKIYSLRDAHSGLSLLINNNDVDVITHNIQSLNHIFIILISLVCDIAISSSLSKEEIKKAVDKVYGQTVDYILDNKLFEKQ